MNETERSMMTWMLINYGTGEWGHKELWSSPYGSDMARRATNALVGDGLLAVREGDGFTYFHITQATIKELQDEQTDD